MPLPKHFHIADFGGQVDEIVNPSDRRLFKEVTITWGGLKLWQKDEHAPIDRSQQAPGYVYALTRDHHRANHRETIVYIGKTETLNTRFYNHPKANQLREMRGETCLSVGAIQFGPYHHKKSTHRSVEEIEHLLIWALAPKFNEKKVESLPGMGSYPGRPWHVVNRGHRFAGRMPREIVYPWMLVKPGRNRAAKQ